MTRKWFLMMLIAAAILVLTACNRNADTLIMENLQSQNQSPTQKEPQPTVDDTAVDETLFTAANIQIAFATDELLAQHAAFHEYVHEEAGVYMIIWTDTVILNFNFIWLMNSFELADWDVDENTELFFCKSHHTCCGRAFA